MIMKKILLLMACTVFLSSQEGCQHKEQPEPIALELPTPQVTETTFPEFLVGTWNCDFSSSWQITFAPDGTIPQYINSLGVPIIPAEGGGYLEKVEPNDPNAIYVLKSIEAEYNPDTTELTLFIVNERVRLEFPGWTLTGWTSDKITGPVSEEELTWKAKWQMYLELDGVPLADPNEFRLRPITFTKISSP